MSTGPRVFVTGSTGNVGRPLVRALLTVGAQVSVGQRGANKGNPRAGRIEGVRFDFGDPSTFAPALDGVERLFLLRPPSISDVEATLHRCVDAAVRAGVRQVVFLSVLGADDLRFIPHARVEARVRASGIPTWTFLRAGFFSQNLADTYAHDIRISDRIYLPAGRGRASFVDAEDLAEVACMALTQPFDDPRFAQRALVLTGPEALEMDAVAELLSAELGRRIRYQQASAFGYYRHLRQRGVPRAQAAVVCALHVGLRFGQGERLDPTLGQLLDRPPHDLAQWIHTNRALFAPEAVP